MSAVPVRVHKGPTLQRWLLWIGWLFSAAAVFIVMASAVWKLPSAPFYVSEWERIGWNSGMWPLVGAVQLTCVALYLTPPTAVLGVVLLTGYLGGAISQYTRMGE